MSQTTPPSTGLNPAGRIVLALVLLLPALLCCGSQQLGPSLNTLILSFQKSSGLGGNAQFVGAANYTNMVQDKPFASAVGFTLAIIVVRLLVVTILPWLIGQGVAALGPQPRRMVRVVLAVGLALFVPVAMGITWRLLTAPSTGLVNTPVFASPNSARLALLGIDGLAVLGVAAAAGAWLYPLATEGGRRAKIVILSLLGIAAITSGLQTSVLTMVATGGGPANSTTTLVFLMNQAAFQRFQLGYGAAIGALILVPVMILGLVAGVLLVITNLRFAPAEGTTDPAAATSGAPGWLWLALGLVPALACCLVSALPLPWIALQALTGNAKSGLGNMSLGPVLVNTLVPAFVSAFLIELPIALVGGYAIGGLRPLGKRSEVILLFFSPWLFVTVAPLATPILLGLMDAKRLGEFTTLFTPMVLSIPLLFVLTLFFKGQATRPNPPTWPQLVVSVLPIAMGAGSVLFFLHLNELLWPYIVSRSPESSTITLFLLNAAQQLGQPGRLAPLVALFWLPMTIVFLIIFGAWLAVFGDQLVLEQAP